jgi:alpha-tubulin suppressor-like RCC1 family protein
VLRSLAWTRSRYLITVAVGAALAVAVPVLQASAAAAAKTGGTAAGTTVEAWGFGGTGELGDGAVGTAAHPVAVPGLSGVSQLSAGAHHSLALLSNGTVMAWGQDNFGQLGDGKTAGFSSTPVPVTGLSGATQVSAGDGHSLALLSNGTVMAWGENAFGQLGIGKLSTGSAVPVPVHGLTGVRAVAAGDRDSFAILADGTVMAWGDNSHDQLGNGRQSDTATTPVKVNGLTGVVALASDGLHTIALLKAGTVATWGFETLGNGTNDQSLIPVPVPNLAKVTAVTAGQGFDLALLANGTVKGWGFNTIGELGIGNTDPLLLSPVPVSGLTGITAITSGSFFSLARTTSGTLVGWGDNAFGQMAGGTSARVVDSPVALPAVTGVTAVSAGGVHVLAATPSPSVGKPVGPAAYSFGQTPTPFPDRSVPLNPESDGAQALSAFSASEAWAILIRDGRASEPLHWDGRTWATSAFAAPASGAAVFNGVFDAGPGDAWAVGTNTRPSAPFVQTIIEHWNGTAWSVVPSPDPAGGSLGNDFLQGVSGSGPNDIWAVGYDFENSNRGSIRFLLAHFNGTSWTAAPSPTPKGATQFGNAVAVASPTDAWAVGMEIPSLGGGNLSVAAHWNGSAWTEVPVPNGNAAHGNNVVTGVTIASATDVWASAYNQPISGGGSVPFLLHFNGTSFSIVNIPLPGGPSLNDVGTALFGIASLGPDDVYAVGSAAYNDGAQLGLIEHYNGTSWSVLPSPQPGDLGGVPTNGLVSVSTPGNGETSQAGHGLVFAGGSQGTPLQLFGNAPLVMMTTKG